MAAKNYFNNYFPNLNHIKLGNFKQAAKFANKEHAKQMCEYLNEVAFGEQYIVDKDAQDIFTISLSITIL
jgi:hypothetical protein